jgi:hypothetical protein
MIEARREHRGTVSNHDAEKKNKYGPESRLARMVLTHHLIYFIKDLIVSLCEFASLSA